jgi:hypothetical protein
MMSNRRGCQVTMVLWWTLLLLSLWISVVSAHQDPCHRLHRCPSDYNTYVCGDKGRCDQCPDHDHASYLTWRTCLCTSSDPIGCCSGC